MSGRLDTELQAIDRHILHLLAHRLDSPTVPRFLTRAIQYRDTLVREWGQQLQQQMGDA